MVEKKLVAKKIRFPPDSDEIAFISYKTDEFKKDLSALIINESSQGACFVVNRALITRNNPIIVGQLLLAKIGPMNPLRAEVRWVKEVDHDLLKIGIELLE